MSKRSIQQLRATYALKLIQSVLAQDIDVQKRFKAYSNSLPAMIQMNGIGQAMAFAFQKSNGSSSEARAWKTLFEAVSHWLMLEQRLFGNTEHPHLSHALSRSNQQQYQLAQAESQALMSWIKDFARAEIAGEEER